MGLWFWLGVLARALDALLPLLLRRLERDGLTTDEIRRLNGTIHKMRAVELASCKMGCVLGGVEEHA